MTYVLDAAVILLVIVMIYVGWRRGFAKTLVQLVGFVAALLVALWVSGPLSEGVFDTFMADGLQATVHEAIEEALPDGGTLTPSEALDAALKELPDWIRNILSTYDLDTADKIISSDPDGWAATSLADLSAQLVTLVIRPIVVSLVRIVCFLILFVILLIAVSIAAVIIGRVFRLPLLRQLDGALGAVAGAAQGVIVAFVLVAVLTLVASTADADSALTRQTIEDTVVVSRMAEINPATALLEEVL